MPTELGTETRTENDALDIHVALLGSDDDVEKYVGVDLADEDVLAVYLRMRNLSPTRVLVSGDSCRLFARRSRDEIMEIEGLELGEVADRFRRSDTKYLLTLPVGFLLLPVFPVSLPLFDSVGFNVDRVGLENGLLHENLIRVGWGQRSLGPGAIETGLLFFDADELEEGDSLFLAVDMRDLVNDWHTVIPVSLSE